MTINRRVTVVITVLDLGVLQISPTTRIIVSRIKSRVRGKVLVSYSNESSWCLLSFSKGLILLVEVFISLHHCISTSYHPSFRVFTVLTNRLGVNSRGRIGTRLINRGCPREWGATYLSSLNLEKYIERNKRRYEKLQVDMHAFDADDGC